MTPDDRPGTDTEHEPSSATGTGSDESQIERPDGKTRTDGDESLHDNESEGWREWTNEPSRRRVLYLLAAALASVTAVLLTSDEPAKPGETIEDTIKAIGYGEGSYGNGKFGK